MRYESDFSLPTYILNKGVHKLVQYGLDVFEMFANEAGLSFCDRNRVISKCRMAYGRPDLQEMPCPDNLKQARWEHYTKTLKYSDDEARNLLHRIDESYVKPFMPKVDVNKLAAGVAKRV